MGFRGVSLAEREAAQREETGLLSRALALAAVFDTTGLRAERTSSPAKGCRWCDGRRPVGRRVAAAGDVGE